MNLNPVAHSRVALSASAFIALAGLVLAITPAAAANATDDVALHRLASQYATLPLEHSFEKDTTGKHEAPYTLTLKNVSTHSLKVSGTIALSVVVHNRPKSRNVPAHTIDAGKVLKIDDLAAEDVVTLNADGFEPLKITVP